MNGQAEKTVTLHIQGMFCAHCEETIRKALASVPGVLSAEVSWEREQAVVRYDPERTDVPALQKSVEEAGYAAASSGETKLQTVSVLVLLLALYIIARRTGLIQVFYYSPERRRRWASGRCLSRACSPVCTASPCAGASI